MKECAAFYSTYYWGYREFTEEEYQKLPETEKFYSVPIEQKTIETGDFVKSNTITSINFESKYDSY